MAAYLICVTAGGGVPLFCRTRGNLKQLPFPVIGSLNGVHMFAGTRDVTLLSSSTTDAKVIWKDYHDSLTLILVTEDDNSNRDHVTRLLDLFFQSMVLLYGLDHLSNIKNIERVKREIKVCFPLLDFLLDRYKTDNLSDLTQCVAVVATHDSHVLQTYLEAFSEAAASPYGCLQVAGSIAVATSKWWQLHPLELVLLSKFICSCPPAASRDMPIFLPYTSPTVPHRLLTYQLVPEVEVCIICGPTPHLADLEREVGRFWRPVLESLRSVLAQCPRNLPNSVAVDPNILGFVLLSAESRRCLCYAKPEEDRNVTGSASVNCVGDRRRALRHFYTSVVGNIFPATPPWDSKENDVTPDLQDKSNLSESLVHPPKETYTVSSTHKCYAINRHPYQLYILYDGTVPTYALRSVSYKLFNSVTHDKHIHL